MHGTSAVGLLTLSERPFTKPVVGQGHVRYMEPFPRRTPSLRRETGQLSGIRHSGQALRTEGSWPQSWGPRGEEVPAMSGKLSEGGNAQGGP